MTMKKLINDPADVVREALQGMEAAHSDLINVTSFDPWISEWDNPLGVMLQYRRMNT
jgi:dihydroxyacetone kinase